MSLTRATIEGWVRSHLDALTAEDVAALTAGMSASIEVITSANRWQRLAAVRAKVQEMLAARSVASIFVRRLLIDVDQSVAAVEWIIRTVEADGHYYQLLGGMALDFDATGQLTLADIHLDLDRSGLIDDLEAAWPVETWQPGVVDDPPPNRASVEQVIRANANAWSSHQIENFAQVYHDEVRLVPPWAHVIGLAAVEEMGRYHFATFEDTQVTVHRIICDPTQPHFGICQQTFSCTNPETAQRGQDSDFAFFEVCQGKLRYWRNYFDSQASVQEGYKTMAASTL